MNKTHHATLVRAVMISAVDVADIVDDAEVIDVTIERFGIDDARALVRQAHQRPANSSVQMLVTRTDFITLEAQNALLKLLEEPPESTELTFVVPIDCMLLPTLQSRFQSLTVLDGQTKNEVFSEFLQATYADRMQAIESSAKKKDINWQREIKRGLLALLQSHQDDVPRAEIDYVARTLLTRGASNKMLLEHVALALPASYQFSPK